MILLIPSAFAQTTDKVIPPTDIIENPDSPLYGLDLAIDQIRFLIAGSETDKARVGLEIAEERLLEVRLMIEQNKLDHAQKAVDEHNKILTQVESELADDTDIENAETENETETELQERIEIEMRLKIHKDNIDTVDDGFSSETRQLFTSMESVVERIEIEVDKDKTRIELRFTDDFDKSSIDISRLVTTLEDGVEVKLSNSGKGSFSSGDLGSSGGGSGSDGSSSNSGSGSDD